MAKKRNSKSTTNTGAIVISALKNLMKNTGWTTRTVVKFIKTEYNLSYPNIGRKISRALKRGVRLGLVQLERGRYRLNNMSGLAHSVSSTELRARGHCQSRARKHAKCRQYRKHIPMTSARDCCCCSKDLV